MRVCLYEDCRVADLAPLTATRPPSDLLCGLTTLGEKQAAHFAAETVGFLGRSVIADLIRERSPDTPANDPGWLRAAPTVLVNARWLPPARPAPSFQSLFTGGPLLGTCDGDVAYAVLDTDRPQAVSPDPLDECLDDWVRTLPARE